jgi:hypothetical protein
MVTMAKGGEVDIVPLSVLASTSNKLQRQNTAAGLVSRSSKKTAGRGEEEDLPPKAQGAFISAGWTS